MNNNNRIPDGYHPNGNQPVQMNCAVKRLTKSQPVTVSPQHNLNINTYSLEELLGIFDLKYHITIEDLKRAKKKVLMLHPDKSKLPADYFLFYKKAFDVVCQFYDNQNRQNADVSAKNTAYVPMKAPTSAVQQVNNVIEKMGEKGFQDKFNELFEQNMAKKPDPERNAWFKTDEPAYQIDANVNTKNMGEVLENIKQKNQGMVKYSGVQNLYTGGQPGSGLYDDDDAPSDEYVSCDPFSKLKYDDLRKVHKDQTVFSVSEADFAKVPKYASVDQYNQARAETAGKPLDKTEAEAILANREREMQEKMMQRQYQSSLRTMEYEQKNKNVMASFLYLGNGSAK
jgi:hypothetical protein